MKNLLIVLLICISSTIYSQEWSFGIGANATFFPVFYDHNKSNPDIFMIRENTIGVAPRLFLQRNKIRLGFQYDILPKTFSVSFEITLWSNRARKFVRRL